MQLITKNTENPLILANSDIILSPEDLAIFKEWFSWIDGTEKTKKTYSNNIRSFMRFLSDNELSLSQVDRPAILRFKESLSDKSGATRNNYMNCVRSLYRFLNEEYGVKDVTKNVKQEKINTREHKKDYLTAENLAKILNSMPYESEEDKRNYAEILLLSHTGLRAIEVSRADIKDLSTKGGRDILYIQGKGHTEKDDFVRVPEIVKFAINEYLKERGTYKKDEPLFKALSNRSDGRLKPDSISKMVKKTFRLAGFDSERFVCHSLRHTFSNLALDAGVSLPDLQESLRHENIETTMIYIHERNKLEINSENLVSDSIKCFLESKV